MFSDTFDGRNVEWKYPVKNDRKIGVKRIICRPPLEKPKEKLCNGSPKKESDKDSKEILNTYLECSSIHGIQYFGNLSFKIGIVGKFLWAFIMIVSFTCLSLMVTQFLRRYTENPVNTFVKTFYTPIFRVPFPAVTICQRTPPSLEKTTKILEKLRLPSNVTREEAITLIKYGSEIATPWSKTRHKYLQSFKAFLTANNLNLEDFLELINPCNDIADACWWSFQRIDCNEIFKISHSSQGVCCSFNYLLEKYVKDKTGKKEFAPHHTKLYGPRTGLKVILKKEVLTNGNETVVMSESRVNSDGVLVSIHGNTEYLGDRVQAYILQANRELQLGVTPGVYLRPPGIRHYNDEGEIIPLCIPINEKVLTYYPRYQYSNCYANCRILATIAKCNCTIYNYQPVGRRYGINSCDLDQLECLKKNANQLRIVKDVRQENITCSCRTPCTNIIYEGSANVVKITGKYFSPTYSNISDGQAVLRVFMTSQVFKTLESVPAADELYLLGDPTHKFYIILGSIGGIFNLFLGCSFLSVVEILYFLGLLGRVIFSSRKSNATSRRKEAPANNIEEFHYY